MISIPEKPSIVQAESQQNKEQEGAARVTESLEELFQRASTVQPLSLSTGRQPVAGQSPVNTMERSRDQGLSEEPAEGDPASQPTQCGGREQAGKHGQFWLG